MDQYVALARAFLDKLALYDRENHAYYSYYLRQSDESAVLILSNIFKELFPPVEAPVVASEPPSVRFG